MEAKCVLDYGVRRGRVRGRRLAGDDRRERVMIAARQIAFGKAAGAKKPYDAEIEYLQGDGKSFIEVPWFVSKVPLNSPTIGIKFINPCTNTISPVFIVYYGSRQYMAAGNSPTSKRFMAQFGNMSPWYERTIDFENEHTLEISPSTGKVIEDGVSYDIGTNSLNQDSDKIVLFARYNTSSGKVDCISAVTIYWMKIYSPDKTELLFDLIPVRKGNVGYMYDRVSGQLFGNAGTGEFVLGSDI
jgi:hypothetical protein